MGLTNADYKFFDKAKHIADVSDYKKVHVGCVAVYQGNVIGIGCNTNKTHPKQKYYNRYRGITTDNAKCAPKLHAEISCLNSLRNLDIQFSKVKLYIYRSRIDQEHGMARPCPACMAAIKDFGIKNVYYTTDEGMAYEHVS